MGVYLDRPACRGGWHSNHIFWNRALQLAKDYGWKPAGTTPPGDWDPDASGTWDGSYSSNDLQEVSAADGRALADALEEALDDIPNHNIDDAAPAVLHNVDPERIVEKMQELIDPPPTNLLTFFAGDRKWELRELVDFCRLGAFEIG